PSLGQFKESAELLFEPLRLLDASDRHVTLVYAKDPINQRVEKSDAGDDRGGDAGGRRRNAGGAPQIIRKRAMEEEPEREKDDAELKPRCQERPRAEAEPL